jgi:hypothetical protein
LAKVVTDIDLSSDASAVMNRWVFHQQLQLLDGVHAKFVQELGSVEEALKARSDNATDNETLMLLVRRCSHWKTHWSILSTEAMLCHAAHGMLPILSGKGRPLTNGIRGFLWRGDRG